MPKPEPFDTDIWTLSGEPLTFHGVPFTTRAVIIRLPDGKLWIHSPVDPAPVSDLTELGPVAHLVAPIRIHSVGIPLWQSQWPDAKTWVSPGFPNRHPDISYSAMLSDTAPPEWQGVIDQHVFAGNPYLDEVVFLHRPSRTLIVTDLIQKHATPGEAWYWRLGKKLVGIQGEKGGTAIDIRASFCDRQAARASRDQLLSWDFDKLIVSHGLCLHSGAKAEVERALSWLG